MDAQLKGSRWGTVSASVMRRPGLSVAAKTVYATLSTYADRAGWIWVRQETLASDLERSRAWVHAAIAELEGQGIVQHDRQFIEGRQRASRYRLQDGLPREAREATGRVSEGPDAAVQPADTSHYDESKDSLGHAAGESLDESRQRAGCRTSASAAALVPSDWVPSAADAAWARSRHPRLDVLAFTETFVLSCRAKGYRYCDPSAAWRRWLIEPKGRLPMLGAASSKVVSNQDHGHDDDRPRHGHRGSAFRPAARPPALPTATLNARLHAWSESWAGEPLPHLPDLPPDLAAVLPDAIGQARRDLDPGDPGEVLAALTTLASRRGFDLPDGLALEFDIEVMAGWPRDLWRKAFRGIWEHFAYRRMPEVADFRRVIEADLTERQSRFECLEAIRLKLETIELKKAWDEEARKRQRSGA